MTMTNRSSMHTLVHASAKSRQQLSINKPLFVSPPAAGRTITAGFSYIQRISRSASIDVWFPESVRRRLDALVATGAKLGPGHFPAAWTAIRQFELLQEAGNYKIYDMDATYLTRTMVDLAKNMRAGGYRVTVASIGSYADEDDRDELEILDRRLRDRIACLTHMLYLEEQSAEINAALDKSLAEERWNYQTALPHIGLTLGARDLFKKNEGKSVSGNKHRLARHFFDILSLLPQKHIVHDAAIGLQLPESIAEHERIYLADGDMTLRAINTLLGDLFTPFDGMNLSGLHGRSDAPSEIKATVQHMRG